MCLCYNMSNKCIFYALMPTIVTFYCDFFDIDKDDERILKLLSNRYLLKIFEGTTIF